MSDWIDESQEFQELVRAEALAKRKKVPEKTGLCLACDEPLNDGVFCDQSCRDDWEKMERIKAIKGKK